MSQPQRTVLENVRRRLYHYLGPETSAWSGMSIGQLQQTIAGTFIPSDEQLGALAKLMHLEPTEYPDTKQAEVT